MCHLVEGFDEGAGVHGGHHKMLVTVGHRQKGIIVANEDNPMPRVKVEKKINFS